MTRDFIRVASVFALLVCSNALAMQDEAETKKGSVIVKAIPLISAAKVEAAQDADKNSTDLKSANADKSKAASSDVVTKKISKDEFKATHTEVESLIPKRNGKPVTMSSFRMDQDGNVVAVVNDQGAKETLIQVYGPDRELIREFVIPFDATAITLDPSGNYIAAGEGKVGRFATDGTVMKVADAPNMNNDDPEKRRQEIKDQFKASMEQTLKVYDNQIEMLQKQIETLDNKKKEDEEKFSARDKRRLSQLNTQLDQYEEIKKQFSVEIDDAQIDAMMKANSSIPSVAATSSDVFVTTSTGMGYEVWRTDAEFENPVKVVDKLSGCCGQMDIFAAEDRLMIAENTRFQVGVYDRDGQRKLEFGERAQSGDNGFGSCCNPMNVICCNNGDILTAESSIGKIKRFNAEGEMIGYVGKARIGGGCKHVSIGFDEKRDRYYIQYEDKNHICILAPNGEAEEVLAEKREKQKAGEAIVKGIEGAWSLKKETPKKTDGKEAAIDEKAEKLDGQDSTAETEELPSQNMDDFVEQLTNFTDLEFKMEGHLLKTSSAALEIEGAVEGDSQDRTQKLTWSVVSDHDDSVQLVLEDADGMVLYGAEVKVVDEDSISVRFSYDAIGQFGKAKTYVRKNTGE